MFVVFEGGDFILHCSRAEKTSSVIRTVLPCIHFLLLWPYAYNMIRMIWYTYVRMIHCSQLFKKDVYNTDITKLNCMYDIFCPSIRCMKMAQIIGHVRLKASYGSWLEFGTILTKHFLLILSRDSSILLCTIY
jgi:hypothetical protein